MNTSYFFKEKSCANQFLAALPPSHVQWKEFRGPFTEMGKRKTDLQCIREGVLPEGLDTSNIVEGKRSRRKTKRRLIDELYETEDVSKMMLDGVGEDEVYAALEDEELEDDEQEKESGDEEEGEDEDGESEDEDWVEEEAEAEEKEGEDDAEEDDDEEEDDEEEDEEEEEEEDEEDDEEEDEEEGAEEEAEKEEKKK